MPHEVETMAYAGEVPWHGLGKEVSNDLTPAQMLKAAGLDWEVERLPQFIKRNGKDIPTGKDCLIRTSDDKILTHVGENWNPVQNAEAFEFFSEFVHEGKMQMHTAGSLKGGQIVWALAKLNESFNVFNKKDRVESFLLFTNPHRYGRRLNVRFTPIRVVCWNTISLALSKHGLATRSADAEDEGALEFSMSHRQKFNPELVKETLGLAHQRMEDYKSMAQFLGKKKATPDNVVAYFKEVFLGKNAGEDSNPRNAQRALDVLETQPGADFGKGTWWQPFNAVTYLIDHQLGREGDTRMHSAWYGAKRKRKLFALNKAVEYANAA